MLAAALLSFRLQKRLIPLMVSFSAGMLLGNAVLNLLPEAFESPLIDPHDTAWLLLGGFVAFFLLEKALLIRHSHHHEGDGHGHSHGHDQREAGQGGYLILIGDSFHNFADGVLVAAAFLTDPALGWITALAIAAHEIPQEIGDFIVLRNAGFTRSRALLYNGIAALAAVAGGVVGYVALSQAQQWVPFAVALSASTLIYIALADLVPGLHRQVELRASLQQAALMAGGILLAALAAVLVVPISQAHYLMGHDPLLLSFIVVIIGGLGSIDAAAIGALIVGLARSLAVHTWPAAELFSIYVAMAVVLVFRPEGLFQRAQARRI